MATPPTALRAVSFPASLTACSSICPTKLQPLPQLNSVYGWELENLTYLWVAACISLNSVSNCKCSPFYLETQRTFQLLLNSGSPRALWTNCMSDEVSPLEPSKVRSRPCVRQCCKTMVSPQRTTSLQVLMLWGYYSRMLHKELASELSALNPVTLLGPCGPIVISWECRLWLPSFVLVPALRRFYPQQAPVADRSAVQFSTSACQADQKQQQRSFQHRFLWTETIIII